MRAEGTVRVLSRPRARLALLVLIPVIPAALAIHFFVHQALLAQHPASQPDSGNALLGQELIALGALGLIAFLTVVIGGGRLAGQLEAMKLDDGAGGSQLRRTLSELWRSWTEARHATELAEAEKSRSALLSSITHDMRSPLTSIKAASTLLLDHKDDLKGGERRELLETIREGADGLDRLITNAVQLSRTRAGGLRLQRIPTAIDEVASRSLERLRHRLRDHRIVFTIPEDLPEVSVDVVQLEQALTNLLENAAKFSPAGTEISLGLGQRGGSLQLRVEDHGRGIPPEEREHVFEPFVKLGSGGGAGLGLPITRAIAEAHGGRILIEDPPSGGTAVVLELPIDPSTVTVPELSNGGRS